MKKPFESICRQNIVKDLQTNLQMVSMICNRKMSFNSHLSFLFLKLLNNFWKTSFSSSLPVSLIQRLYFVAELMLVCSKSPNVFSFSKHLSACQQISSECSGPPGFSGHSDENFHLARVPGNSLIFLNGIIHEIFGHSLHLCMYIAFIVLIVLCGLYYYNCYITTLKLNFLNNLDILFLIRKIITNKESEDIDDDDLRKNALSFIRA